MGRQTFDDTGSTSFGGPGLILECELARRWRTSPRTLQRRRKAGKVPRYIKLGNRILYFPEAVEEYEAAEAEQSRRPSHDNDGSGAIR